MPARARLATVFALTLTSALAAQERVAPTPMRLELPPLSVAVPSLPPMLLEVPPVPPMRIDLALAPMTPMHVEAPLPPMPPLHVSVDIGSITNLDLHPFRTAPRAPWADDDPADSLYRRARELLNRGDWRRASAAFKDLQLKFPTSTYAADALYWEAFALYRIGGSAELRDALAVLDDRRAKYPNARTEVDAQALATRIRGALASRGDATAGADVARTASSTTPSCDPEDQAVRIEALSALKDTDPEGVRTLLDRILQRKDECSVPLRRSAVFLVASRRDASAAATLTSVAKTDPSEDVRVEAVGWMSRLPSDEVVTTLEELTRSDNERVSRAAVRALVNHPSPRARQIVRALVERTDVPEQLRIEALSTFDRERSTLEDATWLFGLYNRLESPRMKARALSALIRIGGPEVDKLLLTIVRNGDEAAEVRIAALRRLGATLPIVELAKMYDGASERPIRQEIINGLEQRKENEATDKLIDIVKTGTDPELRRMAISSLTRKKDPRTTKLLMEIIDK